MFVLPERGEFVAGVIGNHRLHAGLPAGGAHLTVLVRELECLDEAEGLFGVAADGQVTDRDMAHDLVGVDDVSGAESDTGIFAFFDEGTIVLGDRLVEISKHRDFHFTETTLVSGLLGVFFMDEG